MIISESDMIVVQVTMYTRVIGKIERKGSKFAFVKTVLSHWGNYPKVASAKRDQEVLSKKNIFEELVENSARSVANYSKLSISFSLSIIYANKV